MTAHSNLVEKAIKLQNWLSKVKNYLCHKPNCDLIKDSKKKCSCGADDLIIEGHNMDLWE